ncbi:hypothetical protein J2Z75_003428 [Rhizobium herbae]|jgi:hypothetical protein|uniref:Uncharacterized protein n=1 Tax=Rhizobium herbae TaxID=508661 RepID=A0ABS4EPP0_9HYPH|nr:hypothetical protein [Rhizobium herbae]
MYASRFGALEAVILNIAILELERGILGVQRRDARQGARPRTWLEQPCSA